MTKKGKIVTFFLFANLCLINMIFAKDPIFELWNKSGRQIKLQISIGKYNITNDTLGNGYKFTSSAIDTISSEIRITIDHKLYVLKPCNGAECYKTVYLSYDQTGLRPQKGLWHGLLGITDSGYNKRKNITPEFIMGNINR